MADKGLDGKEGEWRDWDGTIKGWVNECPQDFVTWLRKGAIFKRSLATELKKIVTDFDIDGLIEFEEEGQPALMEVEFQSSYRRHIGDRMLLYNDLVSAQHNYHPVWSYLVYLSDERQPELKNVALQMEQANPFIKRMPDGTEIKRLYYTRIDMAEVPMRDIRILGRDGLLPLIPLTQDAGEQKIIELLAEEMKDKKLYNLIHIAKEFTEYRFKSVFGEAWIERAFYVSNDILENTPTHQRILREGAEREGTDASRTASDVLDVSGFALP